MKNRIFYLDFIRVAAMFMIIIFHFSIRLQELLRNPYAFQWKNINLLNFGGVNLALGNYGVSLFFIVSGAALMYVYQDSFDPRHYYLKRIATIYPLYYLSFAFAFLFQAITEKGSILKAPVWTFLLTILGVDGWLITVIPNYALVGDWFIGCIVCIYILFPVLFKYINKYPNMTIGIYTLIFLLWEYFYPFDFPKRNSIILRTFEVLLGMYFIKNKINVTFKKFIISVLVLLVLIFIRINWISLYVLVPVAGMSLFIFLNYISGWGERNEIIRKVISWLSYYSFSIFLVHHFTLEKLCTNIGFKSLGISEALMVWTLYLIVILILGVILKKIESMLKALVNKCFIKQESNK